MGFNDKPAKFRGETPKADNARGVGTIVEGESAGNFGDSDTQRRRNPMDFGPDFGLGHTSQTATNNAFADARMRQQTNFNAGVGDSSSTTATASYYARKSEYDSTNKSVQLKTLHVELFFDGSRTLLFDKSYS